MSSSKKDSNPNDAVTRLDLGRSEALARGRDDAKTTIDFGHMRNQPLYLDEEVTGSHSVNLMLRQEDAEFLTAPTALNPVPRSSSTSTPTMPATQRTNSPSGSPAIRVNRKSASPQSSSPGIAVKRTSQAMPKLPSQADPPPRSHRSSQNIQQIPSSPRQSSGAHPQLAPERQSSQGMAPISPRQRTPDGMQAGAVSPQLKEGGRIGNYEIIRKLAQGGMGVVYEGRHLLLPRRVAIKFLLTNQDHDEEQIRRFLGEAVAAAQIGHKGVVDIYDYGYDQENAAYLVMEYVDGQNLQSIMKRSGQLPVPMAVRVIRDVASVLAAAHQSGVVHRDLKPDNIVLARDAKGVDFVKVLDFGVAKFVNEQSMSGKTQAGSILGTPWYMPPEQCQGLKTVDYRSDIYALGCVMYQMICGKVPFAGSLRDVLMAHIHSDPPRPRNLNPSIPEQVERLVLAMMEKDPADRPASMDVVARTLSDLAEPAPTRIPPRESGALDLYHRMSEAPNRKWVIPVATALVTGLITSAVFYFLQYR